MSDTLVVQARCTPRLFPLCPMGAGYRRGRHCRRPCNSPSCVRGAIGLAVSSTAPTWRDASIGLWILSGVYLICVALASYGLGGYVAGLLRDRFTAVTDADEVEFRDNVHGLLVWAVATLLTALLLLMAASASTRLAAPSGGSGRVPRSRVRTLSRSTLTACCGEIVARLVRPTVHKPGRRWRAYCSPRRAIQAWRLRTEAISFGWLLRALALPRPKPNAVSMQQL